MAASSGVTGRRGVVAAVLALAFAAASAGVAAVAGGWGIPHNDDWAALRIAQHLADTGRFRLLGWNRPALAGQSWPAAGVLRLTGGGVATLQAVSLAAAALVLAAAYLLLRRFVGAGRAALGAAVLLGTPELWLLSTSFMTDALAAALGLGSLLLGVMALQAPTRRAAVVPFVGALAVGSWGVTVRDAAVAAPAAVLVTALLPRRGVDLRALAWPSAVVLSLGVGGFEWWRRSLPDGDPPAVTVDLAATAGHVLEALFWVGLVLSPVTLVVARWRRPATWVAIAVAGCLAAVLRLALARPLFPANYLSARGAYLSAGLGVRAPLVPGWLWPGVCVLAVGSAGVVLSRLAALRPRREDGTVLAVFLALTLGGLLGEDLLGQATYSRYLLVVPPVLAVFLLREPGAVRWRRPVALVAGLTALAVVLTAGTLRSDAARWQAASALVAEGVDPMSIAAGQEWSGWHTAGVAVHARRDAPGDQAWWTGMFADASECWLVTLDGRPRAGYRLVRAGSGVWVARSVAPC